MAKPDGSKAKFSYSVIFGILTSVWSAQHPNAGRNIPQALHWQQRLGYLWVVSTIGILVLIYSAFLFRPQGSAGTFNIAPLNQF